MDRALESDRTVCCHRADRRFAGNLVAKGGPATEVMYLKQIP
jgi:hypothetical protein